MHKMVVVTSLTQLVKGFDFQNEQILFFPQFLVLSPDKGVNH